MHDADQDISPSGFELLKESYVKYPVGSHAKDWFRNELNKVSKKLIYLSVIKQIRILCMFLRGFCHTVVNISDEVLGIVVETIRNS